MNIWDDIVVSSAQLTFESPFIRAACVLLRRMISRVEAEAIVP
ncbi:hypothetical protein [Desulfovibrio inopinatus]|nr:hypothetical protein [Desulfovibrio inopinatus]